MQCLYNLAWGDGQDPGPERDLDILKGELPAVIPTDPEALAECIPNVFGCEPTVGPITHFAMNDLMFSIVNLAEEFELLLTEEAAPFPEEFEARLLFCLRRTFARRWRKSLKD
jgi:hypothetical protein